MFLMFSYENQRHEWGILIGMIMHAKEKFEISLEMGDHRRIIAHLLILKRRSILELLLQELVERGECMKRDSLLLSKFSRKQSCTVTVQFSYKGREGYWPVWDSGWEGINKLLQEKKIYGEIGYELVISVNRIILYMCNVIVNISCNKDTLERSNYRIIKPMDQVIKVTER